jgi:hypothetical protein
MGFGTTDKTKSNTSGVSVKMKNLPYGKQKCKINKIEVATQDTTKGKITRLNLYLESEPVGDGFEGFYIDNDDHSKGRHLGRTGKVGSNPYGGYKDRSYKDKKYFAVDDIVDFIHQLCVEGGSTWVHDVNGKFKNFEAFIDGFNKEQPLKDVFLTYTLGAQAKMNEKTGYVDYYLNIVKSEKGFVSFANDENLDQLTEFDKTLHIYDPNNVVVEGFEAEENADADDDDSVVDTSTEVIGEVDAEEDALWEQASDDELFDIDDI